ncbi:hypothetical protein LI328DRAFT_29232 [Trichoderma asperelloides]|nr:hypothetical protein LI328DRAFT_29232 [Trichoderma asperelloides]
MGAVVGLTGGMAVLLATEGWRRSSAELPTAADMQDSGRSSYCHLWAGLGEEIHGRCKGCRSFHQMSKEMMSIYDTDMNH